MTGVARWRRVARRGLGPGAIGLVYALALLAVFHASWWFGPEGARYFGWDCLREYWQDIVFPFQTLGAGEFPLWNPYVLGGYPFHADPQTGFYSPMNWLLWGLCWLRGDVGPWVVQVKVLLTMWLALLGLHWMVARRTGLHIPAFVAATVYLLGSPLLVNKNSSLLWPMAYLPWAVIALERFVQRPTMARGALLGAGLWLCGSAGNPPAFFYGLLIMVAYWLYLTLVPLGKATKALQGQLLGGSVGVATAALLLVPIYLPAAQTMGHSARQSRGLAYVLQQPLQGRDLAEFVLPNLDANWMHDVYMGPLLLVMVFLALSPLVGRAVSGRRWFWFGVAVLGLVLAMGKHTPVLPWLAEHIPGFGLFRIAYRYKLITGFALAVLAGEGVGELLRGSEFRRWARVAFFVLCGCWIAVATVVASGLWKTGITDQARDAARLSLLAGGLSVVAAAVALRWRRWGALLMGFAALCVFADLWLAGGTKIAIVQRPPDLQKVGKHLRETAGGGVAWRIHKHDFPPASNTSAVLGVREMSGYHALPTRLMWHKEVVDRSARKPALLRHFNVRWLLSRRALPLTGGLRKAAPQVYEVMDAVPLLRGYRGVARLPSAALLDRLSASRHLDAALVDVGESTPSLPSSEGVPVDGEVVTYRRNEIHMRLRMPAPGVAVLNEAYYPGWQATVNGRPVDVFRANHLLRATVVPAGLSEIRYSYRPRGAYLLVVVFLLGVLAVLGAAVVDWRRTDP